jgi:hypothetical protein
MYWNIKWRKKQRDGKFGSSYFEGYTNIMSIKSKRMRWLGMSE